MPRALALALQFEGLGRLPKDCWFTVAWHADAGGLVAAHRLDDLVDAGYPFVVPATGRVGFHIPEPGEIGFRLRLVRHTTDGERAVDVAETTRHVVADGLHRWTVTEQQVAAARAALDR